MLAPEDAAMMRCASIGIWMACGSPTRVRGARSGAPLSGWFGARRLSPSAGMSALVVLLVGLLFVIGPVQRAMAQSCDPKWAEGIFETGVNERVFALTVFRDWRGPASCGWRAPSSW